MTLNVDQDVLRGSCDYIAQQGLLDCRTYRSPFFFPKRLHD